MSRENRIFKIAAAAMICTSVLLVGSYTAFLRHRCTKLETDRTRLIASMEKGRADAAALSQEPAAESGAHVKELTSSFSYQKQFPNLYVKPPASFSKPAGKVIYLTFDDGPSKLTDQYLDILAKHGVKAAFFVVGRTDAESKRQMKRIAAEGHSIGIHTYSHKYRQIYASVGDFLLDFDRINTLIFKTTGVRADMFRFPGGSINPYNFLIYRQLIAETLRRGYVFYDWNISAGDTNPKATAASVEENILSRANGGGEKIILMHDGHEATLAALDGVITKLQQRGYVFEKLTNNVQPMTFSYGY